MRVELPKGNSAELRDVDDVTEGQRRPLLEAMERTKNDEIPEDLIKKARGGDQAAMEEIGRMTPFSETVEVIDATILALVSSWSFDAEISIEGLKDVPFRALDALRGICSAFIEDLAPDFGATLEPPISEDGKPSPKGSGSSNGSKPSVLGAAR